jgi:hypothetical protein
MKFVNRRPDEPTHASGQTKSFCTKLWFSTYRTNKPIGNQHNGFDGTEIPAILASIGVFQVVTAVWTVDFKESQLIAVL